MIAQETLDAAAAVIAQRGLADTTMERVAEAAGISRVTLYRRGVTKEALVTGLLARAITAYRDAMWQALTAPGSASERLEAALAALCDMAERNLDLLVALGSASDSVFHEGSGEGETLTRNVFTEPLERLLRDGNAEGSLDIADPAETATVLFNLVGWTYIHLRRGHDWSPDHARESVLGIALNGVTAERGRSGMRQ